MPTTEKKSLKTLLKKWIHFFSHEPSNRKELIQLLRTSEENHLLDPQALSMIEGVLQVSEMQVRDIMVPRSQMVCIAEKEKPSEFLAFIVDSAHSRFPVINGSLDKVEGILLAKDLLPYLADKEKPFEMDEILRPAIFVPESKRLNVLLQDFRKHRNHMAIVVDEYGGVSGLVTIEDVLEQIVGDISDETDFEEANFIKKNGKNEYTVSGLTPLEEFNHYFNTKFSDENADTITGIITQTLGRLPHRGETIEIAPLTFKVLKADSRRVHLLRVSVLG